LSGARYLFVGERPSATAAARGWGWEDGRLAAKVLFEALASCGIDPQAQRYLNLFGRRPRGPYRVSARALKAVRLAAAADWVVVALGRRVAGALAAADLPHREITHPAARGLVRRRDRYRRHVRLILIAGESRDGAREKTDSLGRL
jgi:hypothetical protein